MENVNKRMMNMIPNKHFNTYKEGLDLEFLRAYCMEHGERRVMAARDMHVNYLRREREGSLDLGDLPLGQVRQLSDEEVKSLL